MKDQRVIKEKYYNEIRKKNCGKDKWLEGKREEVSSFESEIKRIRPKEISYFGLGERESKYGQERREKKGRRRRRRRRLQVWIYGLELSILCMVWVLELLNSFRVGLS